MNIQEYRKQYPQYNDMSDEELAQGLHKKYYSDIDFNEFSKKIGLAPEVQEATNPNIQEVQKAVNPNVQDNNPEAVSKEEVINRILNGETVLKDVGKDTWNTLKAYTRGATKGTSDIASKYGAKAMGNIRYAFNPEDRKIFNQELDIAYKKIRKEEKEWAKEHPYLSTGAEIIGSMVSPVNKITGGFMKKPSTALGRIGTAGGIGAAEGLIYGSAQSDADNLADALRKGLPNAAAGGILGAGFSGIGEGIKALRGVSNLKSQGATGSLENIAKNERATEKLVRGASYDRKFATEIADEATQALENTANRVENAFAKSAGFKDVKALANKSRSEYSSFMANNGSKTLPKESVDDAFKGYKVIRDSYKEITSNNPRIASKPINSIEVLQELRSNLNQNSRNLMEGAGKKGYMQDASKHLKDIIDDNFKGYKNLNKSYAKAAGAEQLLTDMNDALRGKEASNFAEKLLKTEYKDKLTEVFGEEKSKKIFDTLREESKIYKGLNKISKITHKPMFDIGNKIDTMGAGALGMGALYNLRAAASIGAGIGGLKYGARKFSTSVAKELFNPKDANYNSLIKLLSASQPAVEKLKEAK